MVETVVGYSSRSRKVPSLRLLDSAPYLSSSVKLSIRMAFDLSSSSSSSILTMPKSCLSTPSSFGEKKIRQPPRNCGKFVIFPHPVGSHSSRQNIY